jgi:replication factor C small subunit
MSNSAPIWRFKYLPHTLDEIYGRSDIIERLKEIIKKGNFPHLLFVGSEGIGKTLIARLFAKEFLGRYYDANFKVVFADEPLTSEERKQARSEAYVSTSKIGSIAGKRMTTPAFIQIKVKPFVQLKALGDVPYKILVVKNFEALGSDQQGFRRLMEIYGGNCRMILITTKISGIIDPIVSRCQLFLIPQIQFENFRSLLHDIANYEDLQIESGVMEYLHEITEGKIAKAIDLLQLCSATGNTIGLNKLYKVLKKHRIQEVKDLLKKTLKSDKFSEVRDIFRELLSNYKLSVRDLFIQLMDVLNKQPLSKYAKIKILNMIAEADFRIIDGRDEDIQIAYLISQISSFARNM